MLGIFSVYTIAKLLDLAYLPNRTNGAEYWNNLAFPVSVYKHIHCMVRAIPNPFSFTFRLYLVLMLTFCHSLSKASERAQPLSVAFWVPSQSGGQIR